MNAPATSRRRLSISRSILAAAVLSMSACDVRPESAASSPTDTPQVSEFSSDRTPLSTPPQDSGVRSIKGLWLGMPITEAVSIMNRRGTPSLAQGAEPAESAAFKVARISGKQVQQMRLSIAQLVSAATARTDRVTPADTRDLFIVVPASSPDTTDDLAAVGFGILQSVLFTGFFAWADTDGKVKLFVVGPTLCDSLFGSSAMSMSEFAEQFGSAYSVARWQVEASPAAGKLFLHESDDGAGVALTEDSFGRRSVVIWDAGITGSPGTNGAGAFD